MATHFKLALTFAFEPTCSGSADILPAVMACSCLVATDDDHGSTTRPCSSTGEKSEC